MAEPPPERFHQLWDFLTAEPDLVSSYSETPEYGQIEAFENFLLSHEDEYLRARSNVDDNFFSNNNGHLRPLRSLESYHAAVLLSQGTDEYPSKRVLGAKLRRKKRDSSTKKRYLGSIPVLDSSSLLDTSSPPEPIYPTLKSTPFENSFASRVIGLSGPAENEASTVIFRDWEAEPPWVKLMEDIRFHYAMKYDVTVPLEETRAPIDYVCLQEVHLAAVHELLGVTFWPGISVASALEISPMKYTVVAMYKRLVVGVALISPPPDMGYITFVAVKAGWEHSRIGLTMLYHLITASKDRDIILHVSADNPAMLLYNKIGFKSEEFAVGFYEDYLDPQSKACRNALRLRLRQS